MVVPSLNQGRYLRQCLESIVSQGYGNLELLVIDGGSTDESLSVIREYKRAIKYWTSKRDRGQSDAINKGFARATGELVAWLNADDFYLPEAFARVAEAYAADPAAPFYFGDGVRVDEAGTVMSNFFPPGTLRFDRQALVMGLNYILQPSTFINRRFLEQVGYLDAGLRYGMDSDIWMRLSSVGAPRAIASVLSASREYGATKTATGSFGRIEELRQISMKHSGLPMTPGVLCYFFHTLRRLAQEEQGVFPDSYVEDVDYLWHQTQKLLEPFNTGRDGFPREAQKQQEVSLFLLYRSAVKQIDTLTGWVHEGREANAALQKTMAEQQANAVRQIEALTGMVHQAQEANAPLRKQLEETGNAYAVQNASAVKQIETLTAWVHEAREANAALQEAIEEEKKAHAAQVAENRSAVARIEMLTTWVQEAGEQNAAHASQNASAVKQIETLTAWVHEAREANAALQKAMEEQKHAHAREVGALRELMARPMLKLALGFSNVGGRLAKRGGGRQ